MTKDVRYIAILLFALVSCSDPVTNNREANALHEPRFKVATFQVKNGWGYSIFINDKEYIRQLYIPVIEGNIPFSSEQQAWKTGIYVVNKMKNGTGPSLREQELILLDIIDSVPQSSQSK